MPKDRRPVAQRRPKTAKRHELPFLLSQAEHSVLRVFRKYLMAPGEMLCLGKSDLEAFRVPLSQLMDKGLLVAEMFPGGYSLTGLGFVAMKNGEPSRRRPAHDMKSGQK